MKWGILHTVNNLKRSYLNTMVPNQLFTNLEFIALEVATDYYIKLAEQKLIDRLYVSFVGKQSPQGLEVKAKASLNTLKAVNFNYTNSDSYKKVFKQDNYSIINKGLKVNLNFKLPITQISYGVISIYDENFVLLDYFDTNQEVADFIGIDKRNLIRYINSNKVIYCENLLKMVFLVREGSPIRNVNIYKNLSTLL
jgi:hypothetical protein